MSPSERKRTALVLLGLVIMLIHRDRELHFLHDDDLLLLARRAVALVFLVQELSIVLNTADRRSGIRGNLYQVQTALARDLQRLERLQYSELLAALIDYTHFACANLLVDTNKLLGRTLIDGFLRLVARP